MPLLPDFLGEMRDAFKALEGQQAIIATTNGTVHVVTVGKVGSSTVQLATRDLRTQTVALAHVVSVVGSAVQ